MLQRCLFIVFIFVCCWNCKKEMMPVTPTASSHNTMLLSDLNKNIPLVLVSGDKTVTALNALTGDEVYFDDRLFRFDDLYLSQTPFIFGKTAIYFMGNKVTAVDLNGNSIKWSTYIARDLQKFELYRTSPPFVYDSVLYFTLKFYNANGFNTSADFFSINILDGKINWQQGVGIVSDFGNSKQVPVCTNTFAIVAVYDTLSAFNRLTGQSSWKFAGTPLSRLLNPCVHQNKIFVAADVNASSLNDTLFAVNSNDGTLLWAKPIGSFGFNPAPVYNKGSVFINLINGVSCLDAETGNERWRFVDSSTTFSPVFVDDEKVYVSNTYHRTLYAIDVLHGLLIWKTKVTKSNGLLNLEEGPAVMDNLVYLRNSSCYALDKITGIIRWTTVLHNGQLSNPPFVPNLVNANGVPVFYSSSGMR